MLGTVLKTCRFAFDYTTTYKALPAPARGPWLARRVSALGPTAIKMAQFVANRKDVVDKDVARALRRLQDDADPMPFEAVRGILEGRGVLGRIELEERPFASASIAQVHRGFFTRSSPGAGAGAGAEQEQEQQTHAIRETVAVKVRRPGVREAIEADVGALLLLLRLLGRLGVPDVDESMRLVEAFRDMIVKETDFRLEVSNMVAFKSANAGMMTTGLASVPGVFPDLCHEDVIVMDFVPSVRMDALGARVTQEQRSALAYALMDQVVDQFLRGGVMHGDPHGGNIGLSADRGDGADRAIVYYDFGNVVFVDARVRGAVKSLIFELMLENVPGVRRLLLNWPDLLEIKDAGKTDVYIDMYIQYMKRIDFAVFSGAGAGAGADRDVVPIRMSGKLLEIMRVFGLIEGICVQLDPEFSYAAVFVKHADAFVLDGDFLWNKASSDFDTFFS